jgi:predicted amidohydrolase
MPESVVVAAIQLNSGEDRARNEEQARSLIGKAVSAGAKFVALPENTDQVAPRERRLADAEPLDGPLVTRFRSMAQGHGIWLLLGSFAEQTLDRKHIHNTSVLIDPNGKLAGVYRKIHLFDANPPDSIAYRESDTVEPGLDIVAVPTPFDMVGLSVCYDVRFPELYRLLSRCGASVFTVPAAFTVPTGRSHWELLLRARAVENAAYVIAPAQVGDHGHDRRSYGHALIVDPWGNVVADAGEEGPGFVLGRIDPSETAKVRAMLPALEHRRL